MLKSPPMTRGPGNDCTQVNRDESCALRLVTSVSRCVVNTCTCCAFTMTSTSAADRFAPSHVGSDGTTSHCVVDDDATGSRVSKRFPSGFTPAGYGSGDQTAVHVTPVNASSFDLYR